MERDIYIYTTDGLYSSYLYGPTGLAISSARIIRLMICLAAISLHVVRALDWGSGHQKKI